MRAAPSGHGHPGPYRKIAKMALFDPCMEFDFIQSQMEEIPIRKGKYSNKKKENVPTRKGKIFQLTRTAYHSMTARE